MTPRAKYRQAVLDGYSGTWNDWLKMLEIEYDTEIHLTEKRDIEMLTSGTSYYNGETEWHFPEVEDIE